MPDQAGQPTRIQVHISLEDLARRLAAEPGATAGDNPDWGDVASRLWPRLTPDGSVPLAPVPWPVAAPGDECDATIVPVVTGRVDHDLLDKLTAQLKGSTPWSQRPAFDPACDHGGADRDTVRDLILANAVALLSGPGGLASVLRTGALPPLPLAASACYFGVRPMR